MTVNTHSLTVVIAMKLMFVQLTVITLLTDVHSIYTGIYMGNRTMFQQFQLLVILT